MTKVYEVFNNLLASMKKTKDFVPICPILERSHSCGDRAQNMNALLQCCHGNQRVFFPHSSFLKNNVRIEQGLNNQEVPGPDTVWKGVCKSQVSDPM